MKILPPEAFVNEGEELNEGHIALSKWARKFLRPNKSAMHENFSDLLSRCETEQEVDLLLLETVQLKGVSSGTRRKWHRWAEAKRGSLRSSKIIASTAGSSRDRTTTVIVPTARETLSATEFPRRSDGWLSGPKKT